MTGIAIERAECDHYNVCRPQGVRNGCPDCGQPFTDSEKLDYILRYLAAKEDGAL